MIVGLTGPSGAGKSTVAVLFRDAGYRVIDCDALVHGMDGDAVYVGQIREAFGERYITEGAVDRKRLASLVFSDGEALSRLNRLIAPLIYERVLREIEKAGGAAADAVVDAPLLFEYGLEVYCDVTVGVVADPEVAVCRLSARDGRDETEIRSRRSSQHDNAFFIRRCDIVIENNGDRNALAAAFSDTLCRLEQRRRS